MKSRNPLPFRQSMAALAVVVSTRLFSQAAPPPAGPDPSEPALVLPAIVVTATRTPRDPADIPESVTLLTPEDWERTGVAGIADLLRDLPGVAVVSTGAKGAQTALFLRGSAPHQTLILVDGVRMNDRGAFYQNYLGGADLANIQKVEVVRGPQSVLYGGSAMGGVISIETLQGGGAPAVSATAEAGSFSTATAGASVSGSAGALAYSASGNWLETSNERPQNDFRQSSWSARIDWDVAGLPGLSVGATLRGLDSTYEEPGARGPFPFGGVVDLEQTLATAFARYERGAVRSQLILAAQDRDFQFTSDFGATPVHSSREVIDFQTTADLADSIELTVGGGYEPSRQTTPGERKTERLLAAFVSGVWKPGANTSVVLGARQDDFKSVGGHGTWRSGVAHTIASAGTTLRAAVGAAFTAPSLDDRHGNLAFFQPASPDIRPEGSRGWEAGVEQRLPGHLGRVSATWFSNRFRNLFDFDPNTFATINLGRATAKGIELTGEFNPVERVHVITGYTWTDAEDSSNGARLVRRPEHSASVDVTVEPAAGLLLGGGVRWVADRVDVGQVALSDYATVRLHATWQATQRIRIHARIENLFDKHYEEVAGFPALGFGAFGGVTLTF